MDGRRLQNRKSCKIGSETERPGSNQSCWAHKLSLSDWTVSRFVFEALQGVLFFLTRLLSFSRSPKHHVCLNIPSQNATCIASARGWICSFAGVCISPPSLVEPAWLRYEIEKRLRAVYTITTITITTTNLIIMSLTDRFVLCRCPQLLSWWETTD